MNHRNQAAHHSDGGVSRHDDRATVVSAFPPRSPSQSTEPALQSQARRLAEWLATWRSFLAINEPILLQADVTLQEFAALLEIDRSDERPGPTIGMLAESLRTRHNTSVGLITRMCKKGYVRRIRGTRDRRQAHVQLTASGRELLVSLVRAHGSKSDDLSTESARVTAG